MQEHEGRELAAPVPSSGFSRSKVGANLGPPLCRQNWAPVRKCWRWPWDRCPPNVTTEDDTTSKHPLSPCHHARPAVPSRASLCPTGSQLPGASKCAGITRRCNLLLGLQRVPKARTQTPPPPQLTSNGRPSDAPRAFRAFLAFARCVSRCSASQSKLWAAQGPRTAVSLWQQQSTRVLRTAVARVASRTGAGPTRAPRLQAPASATLQTPGFAGQAPRAPAPNAPCLLWCPPCLPWFPRAHRIRAPQETAPPGSPPLRQEALRSRGRRAAPRAPRVDPRAAASCASRRGASACVLRRRAPARCRRATAGAARGCGRC